ncbi:folate-binding protein YgfZ [Corynebacterium sp. HS2168-gen11]|uniref:CAF17-like 4Fe-4S cluster assembly/insertion protein YgfZ n=1 Tax=Corynebacterium sp. HS2168-gen11 TaxID=2974027 RepID=UPI00216B27D4|nr:folate-binding protein [Corynebacterium sp. HS2168-gen11]MCS4536057.1 folate-binding protein [Corynebacterium sp. HS2168-gen11]
MMLSSVLLSLPGAAEAPDADPFYRGVAWHYGNPLGEQRHLATRAFVDRSHRKVIKVSGPDARSFLNNLLSQKIHEPITFSQALNLDMQGHILHLVDLTVTEDAIYLDTTADTSESLLEYLTKMIFWSEVTIEEPELRILSVFGGYDGPLLAREAFHGRVDVFVPTDSLLEVARKLLDAGYQPVGLMAYEAWRVGNLQPEIYDFDAKSLPHESARMITQAVHLNKGCYRGQETVARVENLGRSPRVQVLFHLDGSAPEQPAYGAEITAGSRVVGRLGTVVHDMDYGPIALGCVKRSALTTQLHVGNVSLAIDPESLPVENTTQAGKAAIQRFKGLNP